MTRHPFLRAFRYLTEPRTWLAALAGFAAMEGFFRLAPKAKLPNIDYFTPNGTLVLPPGPEAKALGAAMMYAGAASWVTLYRVLRPTLLKHRSEAAAGLVYGSGLFLFSSLAVFPAISAVNPLMRRGKLEKPGLLGLGLNGWRTPVSNLLGHAVFGLVISLVESASRQSDARKPRVQ